MNNRQKMELVMMVYRAIFAARRADPLSDLNFDGVNIASRFPNILNIRGRLFKETIPGYDVSLDVGEINGNGTMKPLNLRFIAQNPDKRDGSGNLKENAILAQQGHKIMWVINQDIANGFLGKVIDDIWQPSAPRAVYPANQNANYPNPRQAVDQSGGQYNMNQGNWIAELPDIDQRDINNAVEGMDTEVTGEDGCQFIVE